MSAKPCARVWQAEAVLDGVLSRADAASFERHAATCAECTAERAALSKLANVAGRMPTQEVTALRRRALHNELLRRANELSVGADQPAASDIPEDVPTTMAPAADDVPALDSAAEDVPAAEGGDGASVPPEEDGN